MNFKEKSEAAAKLEAIFRRTMERDMQGDYKTKFEEVSKLRIKLSQTSNPEERREISRQIFQRLKEK